MHKAIEAVRADRAALLEIGRGLTEPQWQAESGCPGWRVQDVISHLATGFWAVVDPAQLPDITGLPFERGQDVWVDARRGLSPEAALADYEQISDVGLERLAGLAALDLQIPLGEAGTYPAAVLPHAFSFDHYTHIRADLFRPRGPLDGEPPPADELRLSAALDWIEAALPQQNAAAIPQGTVQIVITGPAARAITVGSGPAKAEISADAPAFIRWVTGRGGWHELGVQASGDDDGLAVARTLKVF